MHMEIERKFLINTQRLPRKPRGKHCVQGYLCTGKGVTTRVRIMGKQGFLTIKGKTKNFSKPEYEYEIPKTEAHEILHTLCVQPLIEKIRYQITVTGAIWIIDEFLGENKGLVLAEIELQSEDQPIILPDWVETEVTGDPRYYNVQLVENPYSKWNKENGQNG
ncbi:MAG: CYTH domain-containing protein [Desulfobulbaceae bacterium]|nr:CYTH domain-containing protein [Desulfobulbaceae bacterium]